MSITSMEDLKNKQAEVKKNLDGYTCRVLVCSGTDVLLPVLRRFMKKCQDFARESRALQLRCRRMFLM